MMHPYLRHDMMMMMMMMIRRPPISVGEIKKKNPKNKNKQKSKY